MMTILNIVIGIIVGAAVVWFLFVPSIKQKLAMEAKAEIIEYSEQLAAKNTEIDLLTRELEQYRLQSEATADAMQKAQNTTSDYEALVIVIEHYYDKNYSRVKLTDELLKIRTDSLGEKGKQIFTAISNEVYEEQCKSLYESAQRSFVVANYGTVIEKLERVVAMKEGYEDGEAILMLMESYHERGESEKATAKYERIKVLFPNTEVLQKATKVMTEAE